MSKLKILVGMLLIATVLFAQTGTALAAPQAQDTTMITGTVQSITLETDDLGATTVVVVVLDDMGMEQTLRLGVDTAAELGLVTLDPTSSEPVVNAAMIGMPIEIDSTTVIPDEEPVDESYSPISVILGTFFGEDPAVIDAYHEDGYGFGVIAQAFWMSHNYGGDASLAGVILEAKTTGDYSAITLEDGSTPTNWGQFKKALSEKKNNLGSIVSGHANNDETTVDGQSLPGNGNANPNANKDKNKDKTNNGKGKDK